MRAKRSKIKKSVKSVAAPVTASVAPASSASLDAPPVLVPVAPVQPTDPAFDILDLRAALTLGALGEEITSDDNPVRILRAKEAGIRCVVLTVLQVSDAAAAREPFCDVLLLHTRANFPMAQIKARVQAYIEWLSDVEAHAPDSVPQKETRQEA